MELNDRLQPGSPPGRAKPAMALHALVALARSQQDLFQQCVDLALTTTRATTAVLMMHRPETDRLEVVASAGHLASVILGQTFLQGEALAWRVFTSERTVLVTDTQVQPDAYFASGRRRAGAYLGVPLVDPEGQTFGTLSVDTTDSAEQLTLDDAAALTLMAQTAGVAYARLEALERAQQTAHRFEQLAELSAQLEALDEPEAIARQALETLLVITGFHLGAVFEVSADRAPTLTLAVTALSAPPTDHFSDAIFLSEAMLAEIQRRPGPVVLTHLHLPTDPVPPAAAGQWSVIGMPLLSRDRLTGMIGVARRGGGPSVPPEVLRLVEMVARRINRAVERAGAVDELRQMREAALRGVGRVLEYRDGETSGHTDRVTGLAVRLGQLLGLTPVALDHLRWGAYLHDVGKVGVADQVLLKPGPLTPEEREAMQRHVVIGEELLRGDAFLPDTVRQVVRHHHERWDGEGYPDRLAGDRIPLLARVFSVVDVYDALTSERPYKRAWSHAEAVAELTAQAGRQFDPALVEVFLCSGLGGFQACEEPAPSPSLT